MSCACAYYINKPKKKTFKSICLILSHVTVSSSSCTRNFNVAGRRATALFFSIFKSVLSTSCNPCLSRFVFVHCVIFFLEFINLLFSSNYRDTPQLNEFIQTAEYLLPTPPSHGAPWISVQYEYFRWKLGTRIKNKRKRKNTTLILHYRSAALVLLSIK